MSTQALHTLPRNAIPGEWVPAHYFRRLAKEELLREGRPLEIDLGCGDGSFLLGMAQHFPERDFLGVERLLGRVRKVCRKIRRQELDNARVLRLDSKYTVEWLLPENAISRIHLLCPDPWPKARHHRRRLIQPEFLEAIRHVLQPGGEFLFMTDHPEYYEWSAEIIDTFHGLERLPWQDGDFFYPKTDFQQLWESEGKEMFRIRCCKPVTAG